jgi:hypothetical protein
MTAPTVADATSLADRLQHLLGRLSPLVSNGQDTPELQLRKSIGTVVASSILLTYLGYGSFYYLIGATMAAYVVLAGAVALVIALLHFARYRSYPVMIRLSFGSCQITLLGVHWRWGGSRPRATWLSTWWPPCC